MTPYILGYKTFGLNIVKVYKYGNNFVYPKEIPFFGYNLNPSMSIFPNNFKCYNKFINYNFNILLKPLPHFNKGDIHIYNNNLNFSKFIKKDYFFNNFDYDLQTKNCHKKKILYECVKMDGLFICKDHSSKGYTIGYKDDYLFKNNNDFFVIKNEDFLKNYKEYIINTQPKLISPKPKINYDYYTLLYFYNYYLYSLKFFNENENENITLYYPIFSYNNNNIIIQTDKYIMKINKYKYPNIVIFDKLINSEFDYEIKSFKEEYVKNTQYLSYYFYYFKYIVFL